MKSKIISILSSVRFWQLAIVAIIQILVALGAINSDQGITIANIISVFLGAVVTIGTVDKVATTASGTATVTIPSNVTEVKATKKTKK